VASSLAERSRRAVVPEAGDDARLVVVVPVEAVPADVAEAGLPASEAGLEVGQPQRPDVELPAGAVALDDARQVSDAVGVKVGEAAGVDLVDHRVAPPGVGGAGRSVGHVRHVRTSS
jgi:hypothetical protein